MVRKRISVKEVSILKENEDKILLFNQFLDDFYKESIDSKRYDLITDEPIYDANDPVFMCMLACSVHKLSNDYDLETPSWVFNNKYFLSKAHYAFDTKNREFQHFLEISTPEEYKSRNLMYGDNVLQRC